MAVDDEGNAYVAGWTSGAFPGYDNEGTIQTFVRKYSPSGASQWTRQFGSDGPEPDVRPTGIATDGAGNVYVGGQVFGELPGQSSYGHYDVFVRKYSPDGDVLWTDQFGTSDPDWTRRIAVAPDGGLLVVGDTPGTLPGQSKSGPNDIFVRRYGAGGAVRWTTQFGSGDGEQAAAIAVGPTNNAYIVGDTRGGLFGGPSFLVELDLSDGSVLGGRQVLAEYVNAVAVAPSGHVYVAGMTGVGVTLPGQENHGWTDAFLIRYDAHLNETWTRQFGSSEGDMAYDVAIGDAGHAFVVGNTFGLLGSTSLGGSDAFIREYAADGAEIWTSQFGTSGFDNAYGVAADGAGGIFVSGEALGTFAGQTSAGDLDAFVRKYAPDDDPGPTPTPSPPPCTPASATVVRPPFRGELFAKTQDFANPYRRFDYRHHPAEDWNIRGDRLQGDGTYPIYPIAPGRVERIGRILTSGVTGYYVLMYHRGEFRIPARSSTDDGYAEGVADYTYPAQTVDEIWSVYLQLKQPDRIAEGDCIGWNTELGTVLPSNASHDTHLHFEIRLDDECVSDSDCSVAGGAAQLGGYFYDAQEMVDAGLRHPSDFLAANARRLTVDDGDRGFRQIGSGLRKAAEGFGGDSRWAYAKPASARPGAEWTAALDLAGTYRIMVHIPTKNATTRQARYEITNSRTGAVEVVKVNQATKRGRWVSLGQHQLGFAGKVKLTVKTGEPNAKRRKVAFDAVRFIPVDLYSGAALSGSPSPDRAVTSAQDDEQRTSSAADLGPEAAPTTEQKLRLHPKTIVAVTGARKVVSAWTCPADDKSPFGPDREPGTGDDVCEPVEADWRLQDAANARLNKHQAHKVLVQLATETDNRLIATYGYLEQGVKLTAKPRPEDKPAPPLFGEEPAAKLRLHPKTIIAVTGARKVVSAWTCPAEDRSPFGPDREPGTVDDACEPVEADWRLEDEENARLSKRQGHKVLVQLASETDNRLIATYEDLRQGLKLTAKPRPPDKPASPLFGEEERPSGDASSEGASSSPAPS